MYSSFNDETNKTLKVANENTSLEYLLGDAPDELNEDQWLGIIRLDNLRNFVKDRLNKKYTIDIDGEVPSTVSIVSDLPKNRFFKAKRRYMQVFSCWHLGLDISYLWCSGEKTGNQFV